MRPLYRAAILVAGALLFAAPLHHASSETVDAIVVERADSIRQESVGANTSLVSLLGSASSRVFTEFANAVRSEVLLIPSSDLRARISEANERVQVEFANGIFGPTLAAPSTPLSTLLSTATSRVRIEFSNGNASYALAYPRALFNDRQAPAVTQYSADGLLIRWITNEFAASVIQVGLRSGTYTQTFTDPHFRIEHQLRLPQEIVAAVAAAEAAGVPEAIDATYYVRIVSNDLSGNQSTSQEYTARSFIRVYLPTVGK